MLETIREMLERDPFVPFEIVVTSGDRFRIENPSLVTFAEAHLTYYFPRSDGHAHLRLNQIVFLQVS